MWFLYLTHCVAFWNEWSVMIDSSASVMLVFEPETTKKLHVYALHAQLL